MFKKNPSRPKFTLNLKKTSEGYKLEPNESLQLFTTRKIVRSIYRPDLMNISSEGGLVPGVSGQLTSGTMIQPPSYVTIPAVAKWFDIDSVHQIQKDNFPEFFLLNKPQATRIEEDQALQTDSRKQADSRSVGKRLKQDATSDDEGSESVFSFRVKNQKLYLYYRNTMVSMWRSNGKKYLSPSICRKNLLGDVGSIMRIHGFLQNWGLINFPSKEHNKGYVEKQPQILVCYVCESNTSEEYYVAEVEGVLFQICRSCFMADLYPQCIKKHEFRKILLANHFSEQRDREMTESQIARMLEIVNGIPNGAPKDRDRDPWSVVQKQLPDFSREQIIKNFLRLPLNVRMNACIFENNQNLLEFQDEQIKKEIEAIEEPSVFEDFQNPILGAIAMNYFKWKTNPESVSEGIEKVFSTCQEHARSLASDQQEKIRNIVKMLIEVALSKMEVKSIFASEYKKLVQKEELAQDKIVMNRFAGQLQNQFAVLNGQTAIEESSMNQATE